jgi:hypothetical protein
LSGVLPLEMSTFSELTDLNLYGNKITSIADGAFA